MVKETDIVKRLKKAKSQEEILLFLREEEGNIE